MRPDGRVTGFARSRVDVLLRRLARPCAVSRRRRHNTTRRCRRSRSVARSCLSRCSRVPKTTRCAPSLSRCPASFRRDRWRESSDVRGVQSPVYTRTRTGNVATRSASIRRRRGASFLKCSSRWLGIRRPCRVFRVTAKLPGSTNATHSVHRHSASPYPSVTEYARRYSTPPTPYGRIAIWSMRCRDS